jgi:hypothetical protein
MAPTLTTKISVAFQAEYANVSDLGTAVDPIDLQRVIRMPSGTAVGQADRCWQGRHTLAASGSENLDLAGGLTDEFGNVLTFVKVKGIYVRAADANVNDVIIGGAASNGFLGPFGAAAHTIAVAPGIMQPLTTKIGWGVTAGTADILKVANGGAGTSVTYDIVIIGTSA